MSKLIGGLSLLALCIVLVGLVQSEFFKLAVVETFAPGYDVCEVKSRDSGRPYPKECQL